MYPPFGNQNGSVNPGAPGPAANVSPHKTFVIPIMALRRGLSLAILRQIVASIGKTSAFEDVADI
jgi:hypothetical protein